MVKMGAKKDNGHHATKLFGQNGARTMRNTIAGEAKAEADAHSWFGCHEHVGDTP